MHPAPFRPPFVGLPIPVQGIFAVMCILIGCVGATFGADGVTDLIQRLPGTSPVPALTST